MPEEIKIEFFMYDKKRKKKVDVDKTLNEIRKELNLSENDYFICFEQNQIIEYSKDGEFNTKLKVIVKDKKVYIIRKLSIKQGNVVSIKINLFHDSLDEGLNSESSLEELRQKLPLSLKNEKFLEKENGNQVKNSEENDTSISEICDNDIIWMTKKKLVDLRSVGFINLEYGKRIEDNMGLIINSDKNVIFFGSVGAGKTTLTNIICGTDFATSESEFFSSTRNIQFAKSIKPNDCIAIDFPGLGSVEDQLNFFSIQQTTLSVIPVRMICFVVKWENRYEMILENIKIMKQIFEDYKDNTVIIITHSEPIISKIQGRANIEHLIETMLSYKKSRIIFSYKNIDYDILVTKKLKPIMENMVNIPKLIVKSKNFINQKKIIGDD